jgi:hypothetical protein
MLAAVAFIDYKLHCFRWLLKLARLEKLRESTPNNWLVDDEGKHC